MVRNSGISPFLMFFDATGTTDSSLSGNTTAFQDISYTWNFGDTGTSGTGTWAYGAHPGHNSRNTATGGVAAHLYVTPGVDTAYVVTVTADDGTNTASCQLGVTAYDPAGSHGFPGLATTCVSSSGIPVAGSGGCPVGAAVLNSASYSTALGGSYFGNGKRVLFKCGDTFTGSDTTESAVKWSIGAYGGCEGTQTNRPIFNTSSVVNGAMNFSMAAGDGRIMDIDCEAGGTGNACVNSGGWPPSQIAYQITLYNLLTNGANSAYAYYQCAQCGFIDLVFHGMRNGIGAYANFGETSPSGWSGNPFNNRDYTAWLGNLFDGVGAANAGHGVETARISDGRLMVLENNTFENANSIGAVLKLHNGNPGSGPTWSGVYTELVEISDNLFTGTSGAQLVETAPQNNGLDERLRNIVIERNIFAGSSTGGGRQLLVSAVNETVRNNIFNGTIAGGGVGALFETRGVEPQTQYGEFYNNTCYGGGNCASFTSTFFGTAGANSVAKNNLFYNSGVIANNGSGNIISNNTVTPAANPGFTNGSGTFRVITDFKPTAFYWGGTSVPVWSDALGLLWSSTWDLGAVHP